MNDTTIITERYEYFQSHSDSLLQYDSWTEKAKEIIRHAYMVDINPSWVEAQLRENRYSEIYIRIVQKCRIMRSSVEYMDKGDNKLLLEQIDSISHTYRDELLTELTGIIREYCL